MAHSITFYTESHGYKVRNMGYEVVVEGNKLSLVFIDSSVEDRGSFYVVVNDDEAVYLVDQDSVFNTLFYGSNEQDKVFVAESAMKATFSGKDDVCTDPGWF